LRENARRNLSIEKTAPPALIRLLLAQRLLVRQRCSSVHEQVTESTLSINGVWPKKTYLLNI